MITDPHESRLTLQAARQWLIRIPQAQPKSQRAKHSWQLLIALRSGEMPPPRTFGWLLSQTRKGQTETERRYARRILEEIWTTNGC